MATSVFLIIFFVASILGYTSDVHWIALGGLMLIALFDKISSIFERPRGRSRKQ